MGSDNTKIAELRREKEASEAKLSRDMKALEAKLSREREASEAKLRREREASEAQLSQKREASNDKILQMTTKIHREHANSLLEIMKKMHEDDLRSREESESANREVQRDFLDTLSSITKTLSEIFVTRKNEPGCEANRQERHVKKGKCFIHDLKLKDNRNGIDDGLTSEVKQLYEKFKFVVETSRNHQISLSTKECDFVALYVFHLGEKRQLDAVLKTIFERDRPNVPWLVVIQVRPGLDVYIDDTLLRNTLLITTEDEKTVFMFNEELNLHSETLELSKIGVVFMNRVSAQPRNFNNLCCINSLNENVFLH